MLLNHIFASLLAVGASSALPRESFTKRAVDFNWEEDIVRGLNLGGWLVLEPWITPSIFQKLDGVKDEYSLTEKLGKEKSYDILRPHWETWITEPDFHQIKDWGFNLVRIPIGYWAYQRYKGDPYVDGAADYLDKALGWARNAGLKVMVDLHSAPGSQNGYDNSGEKKDFLGFQHDESTDVTLNVLQEMSDRYADQQDVVVAIELLNEPFGPDLDMDKLKQFYRDGYGKVRGKSDTPVVIHDAFEEASYWNGFLTPEDDNAQNVILDHHEYQVFEDEKIQWPNWKHRQEVCNMQSKYQGSDKFVVIGEWSAAQTDCAPALNGYGIGSRYEGLYPNSTGVGPCGSINWIDEWDQQLKDDTRGYIEAQLQVYERSTRGWIFWTFKTEASAEWDVTRLINYGVFPQPLDDRKFDIICS
ncbi:MAG: exo-1,3-beta-glucanase [Sclerophora amabilis]|nr:MAG: exo-1,3-beta-glucanase [Sclerophora amabilis]